jgi:predicted kinase
MHLIVLHGPPGVGKLTVAQRLAESTGFKLFHNHLVVDALLAVFEFGSAPFVDLREDFWLSVFRRAAHQGPAGLIFTFAPEATVREGFIARMQHDMRDLGGRISFVELTCPLDVLRARIAAPSRQGSGKLVSVHLFDQLRAAGAFDRPRMPKPDLVIDTSRHTPEDAAAKISAHLLGR